MTTFSPREKGRKGGLSPIKKMGLLLQVKRKEKRLKVICFRKSGVKGENQRYDWWSKDRGIERDFFLVGEQSGQQHPQTKTRKRLIRPCSR